jgi:hypothetical protein
MRNAILMLSSKHNTHKMLQAIRQHQAQLAGLALTCASAAWSAYVLTPSLTKNRIAGDARTILLATELQSLCYTPMVSAYRLAWSNGEGAAFFLRAAAFMLGSLSRVRAPTYMSNIYITLLFALRFFLLEYGFVLLSELLPVIFGWAKKLLMAALQQFVSKPKSVPMHQWTDHQHTILPTTVSAPRGPPVRVPRRGMGRPGAHEATRQYFLEFLKRTSKFSLQKLSAHTVELVHDVEAIMSRYDASTWPGGSHCRTVADKQKGKKDMAKLHSIVRELSQLPAAAPKPQTAAVTGIAPLSTFWSSTNVNTP